MKASIRYGTRYGCRFGQPHDLETLHETLRIKIERCKICREVKRYPKDHQGRVKNIEYLHDHVRDFCQRSGSTRRVYMKTYYPEQAVIYL